MKRYDSVKNYPCSKQATYMYESVHDIFDAILPIRMHKWIESDVSGRSMARDQVDACTA